MNTFRMVMYGMIAAGFALASSGCYEGHRRNDYSGYNRNGSSYDDRNERRGDRDSYRDWGYSRSDRRDSERERN